MDLDKFPSAMGQTVAPYGGEVLGQVARQGVAQLPRGIQVERALRPNPGLDADLKIGSLIVRDREPITTVSPGTTAAMTEVDTLRWAQQLAAEVDAVMAEHPDADPENVRHTLILLRESPWTRLERSLRRGRATPVLAR